MDDDDAIDEEQENAVAAVAALIQERADAFSKVLLKPDQSLSPHFGKVEDAG